MANNINYRFGVRPDYTVGNIVLTAGSKDFTVTNGADLDAANILPGFTIHHSNGLVLPIAEVTDATSGKLRFDCPDNAAGTIETFIRYQPDGSSLSAAVRDLLNKINSGLLSSISSLSMTKGMGIIGDDLDGTVTLFDFSNLKKIADLTLAENQIIVGDTDNKVKAVNMGKLEQIRSLALNADQIIVGNGGDAVKAVDLNSDNIAEGATHLFLTASERSSIVKVLSLVGMAAPLIAGSAPPDWLKANGAEVNRATYPLLWAFAQTSSALVSEAEWANGQQGCFSTGNGTSTFRLPDLRGEFIRGFDDGRGVDAGRSIGSFQNYEIQSHGHGTPIRDPNGNITAWVPIVADTGGNIITAQVTGGNETRPRNIALLYCIRYQ